MALYPSGQPPCEYSATRGPITPETRFRATTQKILSHSLKRYSITYTYSVRGLMNSKAGGQECGRSGIGLGVMVARGPQRVGSEAERKVGHASNDCSGLGLGHGLLLAGLAGV